MVQAPIFAGNSDRKAKEEEIGKTRFLNSILAALMALGLIAGQAFAAGVTIDGSFTDWADKDTFKDWDGADDSNPEDSDITEYRADADANGIYLLMAWDDTSFNNTSYVAVTVRNYAGNYFRVYAAANSGTPPVVDSTLYVYSCATETCATQTQVCNNVSGTGACTGAALASGSTWVDPFPRTTTKCNGTSCNTLDTAVEIFMPWSILGGAPTGNQMFFLQYASYPNAGGSVQKDSVAGANGITCRLVDGVYDCYPSTPTAIDLLSFNVGPASSAPRWALGAVGLMALAGLLGLMLAKKRG